MIMLVIGFANGIVFVLAFQQASLRKLGSGFARLCLVDQVTADNGDFSAGLVVSPVDR